MTRLEIMVALACAHIAGREDGEPHFGMLAPENPTPRDENRTDEMFDLLAELADRLIREARYMEEDQDDD